MVVRLRGTKTVKVFPALAVTGNEYTLSAIFFDELNVDRMSQGGTEIMQSTGNARHRGENTA